MSPIPSGGRLPAACCRVFNKYFALSRTPHLLVDLASPVLAALLALGAFPSLRVLVLGLFTGFAGYTTVYSLNDVVDYPIDKKKLERGGWNESIDYLDAVLLRHPIARGVLSFKAGVSWVAFWGVLTVIGAYLLNPICVLIFLIGCVSEVIYCLMWKTSYFRTLVSGVVKTCGAVAAVFAVNPEPGSPFLTVLFLWLFFWEIGGQNIPADWTDITEDQGVGAKTIPAQLGVESANRVILLCLLIVMGAGMVLFKIAPGGFGGPTLFLAGLVGIWLLMLPAWRLYRTKARNDAMALFNKASHYPLALLLLVAITLLW